MSSMSTASRQPFLDILKVFAILCVVITHFPWTAVERLQYGFPFWIDTAMPIFMMLSGYLCFKSFYAKGAKNLFDVYKVSGLCRRLARFVIPFAIIVPFDILCGMFGPKHMPFSTCAFRIFLGGQGPGSYYIPMMIQFVLTFPLIYLFVCKWRISGVILLVFSNIMYEYCCTKMGVHPEIYRICIFRHLGVVALGAFSASLLESGLTRRDAYLRMIISGGVMFLCGALFLYLSCYGHYSPIIFCRWKTTSLISALYTVGGFYFVMGWIVRYKHGVHGAKYENANLLTSIKYILLNIGKRTYAIFLVQKIFYAFPAVVILNLPINRGLRLALCVTCCFLLGVVYDGFVNSLFPWPNASRNNVCDQSKQSGDIT